MFKKYFLEHLKELRVWIVPTAVELALAHSCVCVCVCVWTLRLRVSYEI
jgi:hypothetical protein